MIYKLFKSQLLNWSNETLICQIRKMKNGFSILKNDNFTVTRKMKNEK